MPSGFEDYFTNMAYQLLFSNKTKREANYHEDEERERMTIPEKTIDFIEFGINKMLSEHGDSVSLRKIGHALSNETILIFGEYVSPVTIRKMAAEIKIAGKVRSAAEEDTILETIWLWIDEKIKKKLDKCGDTCTNSREIGQTLASEVEKLFEIKVEPKIIRIRAEILEGTYEIKPIDFGGDKGDWY